MSYKHKSQQYNQSSMPMKITHWGMHENGHPINTLIRIFDPITGKRISAIMITRSATNKLSYKMVGEQLTYAQQRSGRKSKKRSTSRKKFVKNKKRK